MIRTPAFLWSGLHIHGGSRFSAGAIATHDTSAYAIATGITAKVIQNQGDET